MTRRYVRKGDATTREGGVRAGHPGVEVIESALWRGLWVDVRGVDAIGVLTFDLDFHDELGWRDYRRIEAAHRRRHRGMSPRESLRKWLTERVQAPTRADYRRFEFGSKSQEFVDSLRNALPGVDVVAETSSRGLHVVVVLDRRRPVAEVRALGLELLARLGRKAGPQPEGFALEVFPTVAGATCRLPLAAGNRVLVPYDLTKVEFARRKKAYDVEALLGARRWTPAPVSTRAESDPPRVPIPIRVEIPSPEASEGAVATIDGDLDDDRVRELLGVELQRTAFRDVITYCVEHGIPDDAAFAFLQKFSSLCIYAGLGEPRAMRAFDAVLERGGHRSTHCQTPSGRSKLSGKFRSAFRYQVRLAESGRVRRGALRDRALLGLFAGLLGRSFAVRSRAASRSVNRVSA